ncbi:CoA transferase [Nocardioides ginkgobilobae]
MSVPSRPLAGIRVVDITANVAGPLACQVLRDLGADVVKVEPLTGDAARRITATAPGSEHVTPYFSPHNRGKKSVQLDLGAERGKNALRRLLSEADVLVQGMRPGTLERQGFGAAAVAGINPRCIYVSLSAYGSGSPLEDRPGIDMMVQAESGMLSAQPDGELPRLIPFQLVDGATGHVLAQSVLAALLHRERAGVVNAVEVALYDVACSLQANYLTLHMNTPRPSPQESSRRPVAVEPSGVFATADGHIALAAYVPAHWARFVEVLGDPGLASDPRYVDQAQRSLHAADLRAEIGQILAGRSTAAWVAECQEAGLMAAPISSWREVVESDLFARRGLRVDAEQSGRPVAVVRTPARLSSVGPEQETHIPSLGEHNDLLVGSPALTTPPRER